MNWGEKLGKLIVLKENSKKIHRIKNHSIWIKICGEIKEQNKEIEIDYEEREKMIKFHKIR